MAQLEVDERRARQGLDDLRAAQHGPPDRLSRKRGLLEMVEDDVVGRVLGLAELLQDHAALALELLRIEGRALQDVGEQVDRERHIVLQHLDVIGGLLASGMRVHLAADGLDLLGDLARRARRRALEGHVLEQMGDAVRLLPLLPGADADIDADGDGLDRFRRVGRDLEAVGKIGDASRSCENPHSPADEVLHCP